MKKKLWAAIFSLAAVLCLVLGLTACSNFGVSGTYYLIENDTYVKETYFTLKGGKWTDDDGVSGEYEKDGDKITLYTDLFGTKMEFTSGTLKNGVLTLKGTFGDTIYAREGAWKSANGNQGGTNAKEYTVTYDANGGTFSDGQNIYTQTVKAGNKLTAPTSPTRKNYTFTGWAKSKNGSEMWKFDEDTISSGITLWATWAQESAVILSIEGASIDGREIFMLVDHTTSDVSLSSMVVCSDDSIWKLYSDPEGQREIPTKMVTNLKNGDNKYYIVVNSQNQAQVNVYTLTVHRSYLVTVSYYDGESLLETTETYTGDEFTASYTPDITGYTFNGWKKGGSAFTSGVLWAPLSLYADKTANTYKVTLDVNNGDELSETEKTLTYDKTYSLPVPKRTGYSFTGWYAGSTQLTDASGSSLAAWQYASEKQLTAHWEANNYAVTLKQNDSAAGSVSGGGDHAYDSQVTITATTNKGYTFLGWYKGEEKVSSDLSYKFKMGLAATYTAKWIACPVTLQADVAEGGTVSGVETTVADKETTITAKTNSGYTWLGWYEGEKELTRAFTYTFTMPESAEEAVTYTAKWIKCPVTVQSNDESAGSVSGLPNTTVIGQEIILTATTNKGYIWLGWYKGDDEVSTELTYQYTMTKENVIFEARWEITHYTLTFVYDSNVGDAENIPENYTVKGLKLPTLIGKNGNKHISVGWKTKAGIEYADAIPEGTTGELTLTVIWGVTEGAHLWKDDNICSVCGAKGPYTRHSNNTTICFGEYPQTEVTDANDSDKSLRNSLNMDAGVPSAGNRGKWTDYGYYASGSVQSYMWYIDVEYQGSRYRGVYFTRYRPYHTTDSFSMYSSYQDDNGYYINTAYWFKYEPIEWRILEQKYGTALLMANIILDSQQYYRTYSGTRTINGKTVYPNNYKESDIRAWLTGTFYETAFDEYAQEIIETTTVDNRAFSSGSGSNSYACENTRDKVFLLSYKDVLNTSYGFSSSDSTYDTARRLKSTDYAKSQGVHVSIDSSYRGNGGWWLRSPSSILSGSASGVGLVGRADESGSVDKTSDGVVPALRIRL